MKTSQVRNTVVFLITKFILNILKNKWTNVMNRADNLLETDYSFMKKSAVRESMWHLKWYKGTLEFLKLGDYQRDWQEEYMVGPRLLLKSSLWNTGPRYCGLTYCEQLGAFPAQLISCTAPYVCSKQFMKHALLFCHDSWTFSFTAAIRESMSSD